MHDTAANDVLGLISAVWLYITHYDHLFFSLTCVWSVETVAHGGP
jgi:hypothetical protein